jgi:hypothetical protein
MRKLTTLLLAFTLLACNQILKRNEPLSPTEKVDNKLRVGETIAFYRSETMGIDRGTYPSPIYDREIDTNYFKCQKSEDTDDGAAGGTATNTTIYKAIKAGKTNITVYKSEDISMIPISNLDSAMANNKKELYASYTFTIEN